jgi:hypothetical protein
MLQRALLISGVAVAGLVAFLVGEPASLLATLPILGLVWVSGRAALLLATGVAVFFGAMDRRAGWRAAAVSAVSPALLTWGIFFDSRVLPPDVPVWVPVLALAVALPLVVVVQYGTATAQQPPALAVALRPLTICIVALSLFMALYGLRLRALFTVPAIGVAAAMLAAVWQNGPRAIPQASSSLPSRAEGTGEGGQGRWNPGLVSALVVGLIVAQAAWPLLFWPVTALTGALALAAVFYMAAGALGAAERRQGWAASEYVVVGTVVLAAIIWAVLRLR